VRLFVETVFVLFWTTVVLSNMNPCNESHCDVRAHRWRIDIQRAYVYAPPVRKISYYLRYICFLSDWHVKLHAPDCKLYTLYVRPVIKEWLSDSSIQRAQNSLSVGAPPRTPLRDHATLYKSP